jgi:hypothetical protein
VWYSHELGNSWSTEDGMVGSLEVCGLELDVLGVIVLTPKFGKESDLWVQLGGESAWWKERFFLDVFGRRIRGRLSAPIRQRNS